MKIPFADIRATPFANVRFTFCLVTPELAADWLKANLKNRRLKEKTVDAYAMDVRNGAWLTTHQGIAFDEDGNLIDGQHRLQAIVRAKRAVLILVTTGWPRVSEKRKTMDAVDRGVNRSLADQLHLQHDIAPRDAMNVVRICNGIAAASFGLSRVAKSTTDTILAVFALYKTEITWLLANPITQDGLKQSTVAACLVMARSVWADKTADALNRLQTGENLTRENPILQLRNWLMGDGKHEDNVVIGRAVFYHLAAFVDGKSTPFIIINSDVAYIRILKLHKVRVEKICAIYNQSLPEILQTVEDKPKATAIAANSPEAVKIGESLPVIFSSTDMMARTDGNSGQWLMVWLKKKWIESAGVNQFRKLEGFGK